MTCSHFSGGLHVLIEREGAWFSHCLVCGAESAVAQSPYPPEAGQAAARAVLALKEGFFTQAETGFHQALSLRGDPRCHFAALLSRLGVQWCGNEYHPTFFSDHLPFESLRQSPEWLALSACTDRLPPYAWHGLCDAIRQLDTVLDSIHEEEGGSACDVFLCYRRTGGNVAAALKLCRTLKAEGLRVFCADDTCRGMTQAQFEAAVYHALRTAERLVLFPGDGENTLTPWLLNELSRAACPDSARFICSDGHSTLPDVAGTVLPGEEILARLRCLSASCTPDQLWERGLAALHRGDLPSALSLLQRASAHESPAARLLLSTLYEEGRLVPADAARAAHYLRLCAGANAACRQRVFAALDEAEAARHMSGRRALIYLAADASDAGLSASQALMQPLLSALMTQRRLAGADLCLVGYDRHARVIAPPRPLRSWETPGNAAGQLHTLHEGRRDQHAFAAKGLRLCADHLACTGLQGRTPVILLLTPGALSDSSLALEAATAAVSQAFPAVKLIRLSSAAEIPGCIAALLQLPD